MDHRPDWYTVAAVAATRDLWVEVTGEGKPAYGEWITPAGKDVDDVLARKGPEALDIPVRWEPAPEHYGTRLTDILWQSSMSGFKLTSTRLVGLFLDQGARLQTFDVDIRWRSGEPVAGYLGVLEETRQRAPVHSYRRRWRSHEFVVSHDVYEVLREADLTGLDIEPIDR